MKQSINYWTEKIKPYFVLVTLVLVGFLVLGLWQLKTAQADKSPVKIVNENQINGKAVNGNGIQGEAQNVVASKTGTKYYFPWCGALSRVKPENRVQFASVALARAAGYEPAGNCKGVK